MRVAVIGAGIVGVTTAHELTADGHQVVVFERRQSVASESSFANAGVVAPGYVSPWAAPWMPVKVLAGLFQAHSAVRLGPGLLTQPGWLARYLWACRSRTHAANRQRMQRLALYSRQRLEALALVHRLQFDQLRGYMVLLRDAKDLARARKGLPLLERLGVAHELLDEATVRAREPALSADAPVHAGIWLSQDLVGNCRQFAHGLKTLAQQRGAEFRFGREVFKLSPGPAVKVASRAAENDGLAPAEERFDAAVLCTGLLPRGLARGLGLKLPLAPVYGYSMTAPIRHRDGEPDPGPQSGVMDERFKVSITRLGQRIRVAGIAEMGVASDVLRESPLNTLYKVLDDWYPGAADLAKVQHWKGARPMLPDGPPVIGPAGPAGIWVNMGHGGSGWALACGSARLLADRLAGRQPEIDAEGLGVERWR